MARLNDKIDTMLRLIEKAQTEYTNTDYANLGKIQNGDLLNKYNNMSSSIDRLIGHISTIQDTSNKGQIKNDSFDYKLSSIMDSIYKLEGALYDNAKMSADEPYQIDYDMDMATNRIGNITSQIDKLQDFITNGNHAYADDIADDIYSNINLTANKINDKNLLGDANLNINTMAGNMSRHIDSLIDTVNESSSLADGGLEDKIAMLNGNLDVLSKLINENTVKFQNGTDDVPWLTKALGGTIYLNVDQYMRFNTTDVMIKHKNEMVPGNYAGKSHEDCVNQDLYPQSSYLKLGDIMLNKLHTEIKMGYFYTNSNFRIKNIPTELIDFIQEMVGEEYYTEITSPALQIKEDEEGGGDLGDDGFGGGDFGGGGDDFGGGGGDPFGGDFGSGGGDGIGDGALEGDGFGDFDEGDF